MEISVGISVLNILKNFLLEGRKLCCEETSILRYWIEKMNCGSIQSWKTPQNNFPRENFSLENNFLLLHYFFHILNYVLVLLCFRHWCWGDSNVQYAHITAPHLNPVNLVVCHISFFNCFAIMAVSWQLQFARRKRDLWTAEAIMIHTQK